MKRAFRYRLFGPPKPPAEMRACAARADVLLAADGVSIKCSGRAVRLPGVRASRSVRLLAGSIVVLPDRLLASVGSFVVLDAGRDDPGKEGQTLAIAEDGVHITVELSSLLPEAKGTIELTYRGPVDPAVISQALPTPRPVAVSDTFAVMARQWV
jgi:hypothetical protein